MRKIVFEERPVDTREGNRVEIFTLEEIESHFTETLRQIMSQVKLADTVSVQGHAEDAEEILRSQIVLAEAAYDYFLHELLRLGIMNLHTGDWEDNGEKFKTSRLYTKLCFDGTNSLQLLRKIVSIHRKLYRLCQYHILRLSLDMLVLDFLYSLPPPYRP